MRKWLQSLVIAFALASGMLIGTLMSQRQWLTDTAEATHGSSTTDCVGSNLNFNVLVVSLTNTRNSNRNANVVIRDKNGADLFNDNAFFVGNGNTEYVRLNPTGNNNAAWVHVRGRRILVAAYSDHTSLSAQNENHRLKCYT